MDCSLPTRLEYNLRIIKSPGLIQILSIMEKKILKNYILTWFRFHVYVNNQKVSQNI